MKTREIAEFLNGTLTGDGDIEILRVAALDCAAPNELGFVEKAESFDETASGCLLVPENFEAAAARPIIRVKNPKLAFALVAAVLHPPKMRAAFAHPTAVIAE